MSGPESQQPDDLLLKEFLAGRGAVRESYRAVAQEQAPAPLDATILQMAQAEAPPPPRLRRSRWQVPMAAAAVVVLSFGVLMQMQRDPAAQAVRMAVPPQAAPAAPEPAGAEETVEGLTESLSLRDAAEAGPKRAPSRLARPSSTVSAEPGHALVADTLPPPAPPPVMTTAGAAAAAVPMNKASRAPRTTSLMSQYAPAHHGSDAAFAIERWAQGCGAGPAGLSPPVLWRGLAVRSWMQQAEGESVQAMLSFAPEVTQEAITDSLGALATKATFTTAQCAGPITRELRASNDGWVLICDCTGSRPRPAEGDAEQADAP